MARLLIRHHQLVVKLNFLEKVMALRGNVRVPLAKVETVSVLPHPVTSIRAPMIDVSMGFAASSAPLARVATIGPRARYLDGHALVIVWGNRPSVVVEMNPGAGRWRLLVVSVPEPDAVAQRVRSALP